MPTHVNCNDIVDFTFRIGTLFIMAALLAAAAMALAEAIAKFRTKSSAGGTHETLIPAKIGDILAALKDLLIALGNLPVWFAIFLAGGTLIWFARDTINLCH